MIYYEYFVTLLYASISPFRSSCTPAIGCVLCFVEPLVCRRGQSRPADRPSAAGLVIEAAFLLAPIRGRPSVSTPPPPRCYVLTAGRLYGLTLLSIRLCVARVRTSGLQLPARGIAVVTGMSWTCGPSLRGRPDLCGRCHAGGLFESVGC